MAATRPHAMRIDDDVWSAAIAKAEAQGTSVTRLVEQFLAKYAGMPDPQRRPGRPTAREVAVCNACGWEGPSAPEGFPCPQCGQNEVNHFST